jgi:hypothetical protein
MLCWGDIDNDTTSNHPVAVSGMPGSEAAVTVGTYGATCALSKVGGVRCFGYNYDGTLGNGTDTNSNTPVHVKGISTGATAISLAEYTGCALLKGGSIKCWGYVPTGNGLSLSPVTLPWYA